MGLLDNLQGKWVETTQNIQGGRFDARIADTEKQITEQLTAMGRIYLEKHREDAEEEFATCIETIKKLEEEKENLEKGKLASQGLRKCESCGQLIPLNSAFCNQCGAKLEPVSSSGGGNICPSCGAPVGAGDAFCTGCGARISG